MNTFNSISSATLNNKKTRVIVSNPTLTPNFTYAYTTSRQSTIACSVKGQYVSYCCNDSIYTSQDYGVIFNFKSIVGFPFTSIAISTSGQYQFASSTGSIQESAIWGSSDYGVTWTKRASASVNNGSRFIERVLVSSSGGYVMALGNGGAGLPNAVSTDFGVTFNFRNEGLCRTTGCISGTNVLLYESYNAQMRRTDLSIIPNVETMTTASPYGSGIYLLSADNIGTTTMIHSNHPSMQVSTDFGVTWLNRQGLIFTPKFTYISGGKIWATSSNMFYRSDDLGITFTLIYTLPAGETIKSFCGNITYINFVCVSGKVGVLTLS